MTRVNRIRDVFGNRYRQPGKRSRKPIKGCPFSLPCWELQIKAGGMDLVIHGFETVSAIT